MTITRIIDGKEFEFELTYGEVMRCYNRVTEDIAITTLESVLDDKWYNLTEQQKRDALCFYMDAMDAHDRNNGLESTRITAAHNALWFVTQDETEDE